MSEKELYHLKFILKKNIHDFEVLFSKSPYSKNSESYIEYLKNKYLLMKIEEDLG